MKVSVKTSLFYGLGSLGQNFIYVLVVSYLMVYYTDYFGLAPAAVGTLFLVARIWDALDDPIIGLLVDNTKSKYGKFRPYLLYTPVIMAAFTVLLFLQPDLSSTAKIIYAYVTYIMWGMSYTILDVPYWSMTATITDDPKERTKVVMVPRVMAIIAAISVSVITLPLVKALNSWLLVALIYSVICVLFFGITFWNVKEKVNITKKEKYTLKDAGRILKSNRPLQLILLTLLIGDLTMNLRGAFSLYYFKYYLNAEKLFPLYSLVTMLPILIGALLSPIVSKKIGKRMTAIGGNAAYGSGFILLFFLGKNIVLLFVISGLSTLFFGLSMIAMSAMVADCVEYGEWRTGKRAEGTVFSTNTFRSKFADALGGAMGAYALSFIGYIPNQAQTDTTMSWMHLFFTIIPGIFMLVAVLPLIKYELTETFYNKILAEIKIRREGNLLQEVSDKSS
ncbi:glycoside-pentoside-hexuronide (GPH):cation symporter [Priestia abyssalis]|uniref:glycoside-pentoside-hexuronide (GPH):cation symporter n=1 Tax=Priestia abyssalis TaxID=1221450 RepID=UPI001F305CB7|nr:glycoside-pentoside-hexuronide (GPH):cation symporter [Priestia abyssalis]